MSTALAIETVMDPGQPIVLSTSLLVVTRYLQVYTGLRPLICSKTRPLRNMSQIH